MKYDVDLTRAVVISPECECGCTGTVPCLPPQPPFVDLSGDPTHGDGSAQLPASIDAGVPETARPAMLDLSTESQWRREYFLPPAARLGHLPGLQFGPCIDRQPFTFRVSAHGRHEPGMGLAVFWCGLTGRGINAVCLLRVHERIMSASPPPSNFTEYLQQFRQEVYYSIDAAGPCPTSRCGIKFGLRTTEPILWILANWLFNQNGANHVRQYLDNVDLSLVGTADHVPYVQGPFPAEYCAEYQSIYWNGYLLRPVQRRGLIPPSPWRGFPRP